MACAKKQAEQAGRNLQGQLLGAKGRETRRRILEAAERLLAAPTRPQITLSAIAREASLGMTTLYLYFTDLPELLFALLEQTMETADEAHIGHLRQRWPDRDLYAHCLRFVQTYYGFWERHSRILHLRDFYAENLDARMMRHRLRSARLLISLLVDQMDGDPAALTSPNFSLAAALCAAIIGVATGSTNEAIEPIQNYAPTPEHVAALQQAMARIFELGITEGRSNAAKGA